jgi:organic hydroperoxide reductase OsmC/OhrA
MEETHQYRVVAWWTSGRTGIAKSNSAPNAIHFTAAPEFGGLQGRWTPEELLLGSVGGCFTTTFRAVAAHSNFEYTDLEVETEGTVAKTADGYRFGEIFIRPKLTIFSEDGRHRAVDLLKKTKALCLVSRALAVTQRFEPLIAVGKAVPVG